MLEPYTANFLTRLDTCSVMLCTGIRPPMASARTQRSKTPTIWRGRLHTSEVVGNLLLVILYLLLLTVDNRESGE